MIDFLIPLILLHLPQSLLMLHAGILIRGYQLRWSSLLAGGAVRAVILALARAFLPLGPHVVIIAVAQVIILRFIVSMKWVEALFVTLLTILLVVVGEGILAVLLFKLAGLSFQDSVQNAWLQLVGGWVGMIPLILLSLFLQSRSRGQFAA